MRSDMGNSGCCALLPVAFPGSRVHVIHLGHAGEGKCVCLPSRVFCRISAVADKFNSWFSQCNFCLSSVLFLLNSRRYCLETRYLAPGIATAFCLLLHSLNCMKLVAECSLIKSLNFVSPGGDWAAPLGMKIWLEGGSLWWTSLWRWAGLAVGRSGVGGTGQSMMVVPVFRCSSSQLPHWEDMTQREVRQGSYQSVQVRVSICQLRSCLCSRDGCSKLILVSVCLNGQWL